MSIEALRRKARKQGLFIRKSPNQITGGYMIVDENKSFKLVSIWDCPLQKSKSILKNNIKGGVTAALSFSHLSRIK